MLSKEKIKQLKSLQQQKHRDETGLFTAEGPKLLDELFASSLKIHSVYYTCSWEIPAVKDKSISFTEITEDELKKISNLVTPNQVFAVVHMINPSLDKELINKDLTLILDDIHDPGNLGTIIRIADWFGVEQVICSPDCVNVYNPKVIQASMGSVFRVKVFYRELTAFIDGVNDEVPVYGAFLDGDNVLDIRPESNAMLVIGSESHGISKKLEALITRRISIPAFRRAGNVHAESLNASVATGILLNEFRRHHYYNNG